MNNTLKFKYPLYYAIIYAIGCLMMFTIVLGIGITSVLEGSLGAKTANWNDWIFNFYISLLIPLPLLFLGLICAKRLKYAFVEIILDEEAHRIVYKRGKVVSEIKFTEIVSSRDLPNKGVLVLEGRFKNIKVPKEINNYLDLYKKLDDVGIPKNKIDFKGFKTNHGLMYWFIVSGLFIFGSIPLVLAPNLIMKFDGSSDAIAELVLVLSLSGGMFLIILFLSNRYEFTERGLLKINPIYKKLIPYTNIKEMEILESRRILSIRVENDKFEWLRNLNLQSGMEIHEPGNISIEGMYSELERRMKEARIDSFFGK